MVLDHFAGVAATRQQEHKRFNLHCIDMLDWTDIANHARTVNSEIFVKIQYSQIVLKDVFATLEI